MSKMENKNEQKQKKDRKQYTLADLVNKFNTLSLEKTKEKAKNGERLGSRT